MPENKNSKATPGQLDRICLYIKKSWTALERNLGEVLDAITDPKITLHENVKPCIYVSPKEDFKSVERRINTVCRKEHCQMIELSVIPDSWREMEHHGLLYLPHPYVVPGGSFNEMYGWDSYFITRGLLRDDHVEFARDMAENHFYQVEKYGTVLNANRTYYLTRSQPPFLSGMALIIFRSTDDREWLRRALPAIEEYYRYWAEGQHCVKEFGLSRYYDFGDSPAPEVLVHECDDQGRTHYERVREFYRERGDEIKDYDLSLYYDRASDRLTPLFYRADRSMRESGHDPSYRFGAFNIGVLDMLPVDLNCLLYKMEMEIAEILTILERQAEATHWQQRAGTRATLINDLMWDEKQGLYFDYNYDRREWRVYPYVTTFFPMWVGIASREQAARIVDNLWIFECAGGLQTSACVTGNQWDAPLGWAPMQLIAVEGLRRYGYAKEADRISINFLSMILKEFIEHDAILEKYNVVRRESDVPAEIKFGYSTNQVGFGWTNAAFAEMLASLPDDSRGEVLELSGVGDFKSSSKQMDNLLLCSPDSGAN